jgi:hypothetical protein
LNNAQGVVLWKFGIVSNTGGFFNCAIVAKGIWPDTRKMDGAFRGKGVGAQNSAIEWEE